MPEPCSIAVLMVLSNDVGVRCKRVADKPVCRVSLCEVIGHAKWEERVEK